MGRKTNKQQKVVGNWVTGCAIPRRNACIFYSCRDLWALLKLRGGCCSNQSRSQIHCSANNEISILHNSSQVRNIDRKSLEHAFSSKKFKQILPSPPPSPPSLNHFSLKFWANRDMITSYVNWVNTILVQIFLPILYSTCCPIEVD